MLMTPPPPTHTHPSGYDTPPHTHIRTPTHLGQHGQVVDDPRDELVPHGRRGHLLKALQGGGSRERVQSNWLVL